MIATTTAPFADFLLLWDTLTQDMDRGIPLTELRDQLLNTGRIFAETADDPRNDVSCINLRRAYKRMCILIADQHSAINATATLADNTGVPYIAPLPRAVVDAPRDVSPIVDAMHNTPNGIYTVVMGDGTHVTIRIKQSFVVDAAKEDQMAEFLCGSDNERDYKGFAFVKGNRGIVWKRFRPDNRLVVALNALLQGDFTEYGARYAMLSGNCWHCGRTLTVPASLHRGLGPVCAEKLGVI